MGLRIGRYNFTFVTYDDSSDVIYAKQDASPSARREQTPEQHVWLFDEDDRFHGVALMEPRERLERVARLGLLKALDGYDASRTNGFSAYATPTILGELRRHFRDRSWSMRVPRDLKEAIPRIRTAIADLATEKGRMPDEEEVA